MKYEITKLNKSYVVRPENQLGTCGWVDNKPWSARFFNTLAKAQQWINNQKS